MSFDSCTSVFTPFNLTKCSHEILDQLPTVQAALNCDKADNSPGRFKVNPTCLNRGQCGDPGLAQPLPEDYPRGKCVCAAPDDPDNWAGKDEEWVWGGYTGDTCKDWTYYYNAVISYIIHFKYNAPTSADYVGIGGYLECAKGPNGNGNEYGEGVWEPVPSLTPIAQLMLKFSGYSDLADAGKEFGNYNGTVIPYQKDSADQKQHCKICKDDDKCFNLKDGEVMWPRDEDASITDATLNAGGYGYLMLSYATDYNSWYDVACEDTQDGVPYVPETWQQADDCPAKQDKGLAARMEFHTAVIGAGGEQAQSHHLEHWLELTKPPTTENVRDEHTQGTLTDDDWPAVYGLNWGDESLPESDALIVQHRYVSWGQSGGTSEGIIQVPTVSPTISPTPEPTSDDCFTMGYTHSPNDLVYAGISEDMDRGCRWGLKLEWEGGNDALMCDSPYVVCLPEENTPNNNGKGGFPMANGVRENYQTTTHKYTVDECKRECAYDQRCTGFEFRANDGQTGDCLLIDDVPMETTSPGGSAAHTHSEATLNAISDWTTLNGAVCYRKDVDCNPYFQESQLSDVMLQCYCPNNRKGFYTKNVVRTVAATEFCGMDNDGSITKRIREAQANRMFHLCENWCLFNTQSPRTESWYHDPWRECWREQYAGVGTHRSYCYRVIRDPYTIEQLFIDTRSANMCNADDGQPLNTPSPTYGTAPPDQINFFFANAEDSCDDACTTLGGTCVENIGQTFYTEEANAGPAFTEAFTNGNMSGDCSAGYETGNVGWAHPSLGPNGECILRDADTNDAEVDAELPTAGLKYMATTGCNVAIGVGYRRLCSCTGLTPPP